MDLLTRREWITLIPPPKGQLHDDASLVAAYAAADVVAIPSRHENFPNVMLEAMACRRPVVGFREGGLPDVIQHERDGFLAAPYDVRDLARGLAWALDPQHSAVLGDLVRRKVLTGLTVQHQAGRYLQLYRELCEPRALASAGRQ